MRHSPSGFRHNLKVSPHGGCVSSRERRRRRDRQTHTDSERRTEEEEHMLALSLLHQHESLGVQASSGHRPVPWFAGDKTGHENEGRCWTLANRLLHPGPDLCDSEGSPVLRRFWGHLLVHEGLRMRLGADQLREPSLAPSRRHLPHAAGQTRLTPESSHLIFPGKVPLHLRCPCAL